MADERRGCEQCGAMFAPQREHSRFCTARCRAAWNREHLGDPADEASALTWSVTAMSEATARLAGVSARERPRGLTPIEEAVWWITMVDATLVRHHPAVYDAVLAAQAGAEGRLIKETLAGLRFVRNWIGRGAGLGEIIETGRPGAGNGPITSWTWKPVPGQALASLPPRGQAWEMSRYRAYQARLASRTIGETIGRAVTFLAFTGANVASSTDAGQRAARS